MPENIIKSFSQKSGKPEKEIEKLWKKAKKLAKDMGEEDNYAYTVGVLKNMLGIEESSPLEKWLKSDSTNFLKFISEEEGLVSTDISPENRPEIKPDEDEVEEKSCKKDK